MFLKLIFQSKIIFKLRKNKWFKLADAYTKIHEKEQLPESLKKKEKEMKDEVGVFLLLGHK